jgi:hypothetical protein
MDLRAQFVQILQDRAGLDPSTAERVTQVAVDFAGEHAPDLIAQYAPEPFKSLAAGGGSGQGGIGGILGGLAGR